MTGDTFPSDDRIFVYDQWERAHEIRRRYETEE